MVQVNLHCHSIFSDGEQTPEALAASLAQGSVRCAALTDHDSIEGLPRFQEALRKRGIAFLPGVEITTRFAGLELHLLGYGFDPTSQELGLTLQSLRQMRDLDVHSIAGSLRKIGTNLPPANGEMAAQNAAPTGRLGIADGIAMLHRAGGKAFLAHPLVSVPDFSILDDQLRQFKQWGPGSWAQAAPPGRPARVPGWSPPTGR